MLIVPPGGFAGFNNMTPASRAALSPGRAASTGPRRRRRKSAKASGATRRRRRSGARAKRSGRRMKFGSPAWQKKYRVGRYAKK